MRATTLQLLALLTLVAMGTASMMAENIWASSTCTLGFLLFVVFNVAIGAGRHFSEPFGFCAALGAWAYFYLIYGGHVLSEEQVVTTLLLQRLEEAVGRGLADVSYESKFRLAGHCTIAVMIGFAAGWLGNWSAMRRRRGQRMADRRDPHAAKGKTSTIAE